MNGDLRVRAPRPTVALRAMREADLAAMHRLVLEMSWPHQPEDCAMLLALGHGVVALDADGQVIGAGMGWAFGAQAGTVGMVLVAPAHQGRGIGRTLMAALIERARPLALMLNATAEGIGLYEQLGFGRIGLVRQHQARRAGPAVGPAVPRVPVRRAMATDGDALRALDAAAFGAPRTALIDRLLVAGETWVTERDARLAGFAILRDFGRGQAIGPVIAPNEDTAIALVAVAAGAARPGMLRVDVPAHAQRLGEWLAQAGLPPVGTVTTMLRGAWPAAQNGAQRFALAMQALG